MTTPQSMIGQQAAPDGARLARQFERLAQRHGYVLLGAETFDEFVRGAGDRVVLFAEDPVRSPESWDMTVVLPELIAAAGRPFQVGLLPPLAARERAIAWSVHTWPALLFQRDGATLGLIEGMRDWSVFAQEIPAMLARRPGRRPGIGIGVSLASGRSSACH